MHTKRVLVAIMAAMIMTIVAGFAAPAIAQDEAKKDALPGVKEQLGRLRVHHEAWSASMRELDSLNAQLKANLGPLEKAKNDEEFFKIVKEKVVPSLQMWRQDIRARKGQFLETQSDLREAVNATVLLFEANATKCEKMLASDTLRTAAGKKQVAHLGQGFKKTATAYRDYNKDVDNRAQSVNELLDYAEDSGVILEGLDGLARGVIDVAGKKAAAEGNIQELRDFLNSVRQTLDRALEQTERRPKLPAPAVPGLDDPAKPAPPAKKAAWVRDHANPGLSTAQLTFASGEVGSPRGRVLHVLATNSARWRLVLLNLGDGTSRQNVAISHGNQVTVLRTSPLAPNLSCAWCAPGTVSAGDVAMPVSREIEFLVSTS